MQAACQPDLQSARQACENVLVLNFALCQQQVASQLGVSVCQSAKSLVQPERLPAIMLESLSSSDDAQYNVGDPLLGDSHN